jgi:catechol 2,3-dioxygenase-like lactoylglutathione lyase family enzyme
MLGEAKAIAFIGVSDLNAGRAFYEGVLGLAIVSQDDFAVVADAGGVTIRITQPPQVTAAPYTVLGFQVEDVSAAVAGLVAKGVVFERYPWFGDAQGPDGVWLAPSGTRVAWFKDPDGNLLSISGPDA